MTPLQFEEHHQALWSELDVGLACVEGRRSRKWWKLDSRKLAKPDPALDPARLAALYRAACEQLALARSRAYPVHLIEQLEDLTQRGHQVVYHGRSGGASRIERLFLVDIPQAVRAHRVSLTVATLAFVVPLLVLGLITYFDPGFVLTVNDADSVRDYDRMYSRDAASIGRTRNADTDWAMFGYYIMNNIGIAFQCFAAGVFFGIGSLFYLAFNGAFSGTVAGYLTARGYSETFYSFVVTHGAFELTAIVIAGAAGLSLGYSLLAPGRYTRARSLQRAAADAVPLLYLVFAMLVIAAAIEAFWSSSRWVSPIVKYGVGGACWVFVLGYLGWQGRPRRLASHHADKSTPGGDANAS